MLPPLPPHHQHLDEIKYGYLHYIYVALELNILIIFIQLRLFIFIVSPKYNCHRLRALSCSNSTTGLGLYLSPVILSKSSHANETLPLSNLKLITSFCSSSASLRTIFFILNFKNKTLNLGG